MRTRVRHARPWARRVPSLPSVVLRRPGCPRVARRFVPWGPELVFSTRSRVHRIGNVVQAVARTVPVPHRSAFPMGSLARMIGNAVPTPAKQGCASPFRVMRTALPAPSTRIAVPTTAGRRELARALRAQRMGRPAPLTRTAVPPTVERRACVRIDPALRSVMHAPSTTIAVRIIAATRSALPTRAWRMARIASTTRSAVPTTATRCIPACLEGLGPVNHPS